MVNLAAMTSESSVRRLSSAGLAAAPALLLVILALAAGYPVLAGGAVLVVLTVVVAVTNPRGAIPAVVGYLAIMSGARRVLEYNLGDFGDLGDLDPLLAVAPAVAFPLAYIAARSSERVVTTPLGVAMRVLLVVSIIGIFNPLQGPLAVGVVGYAFFGVPLLWFWVGRYFVDDRTLSHVLRVIGFAALAAAAYGISQSTGRLPPWDALWVDTVDLPSLRVDGQVKAFSTFASPGEFARYMSMGLLIWVVGARWRSSPISQRLIVVIAVSVLAVALVVPSVRIAVLLTALGLGAVLAAQHRLSPVRASTLAVLALLAVVAMANIVQGFGPTGNVLVDRQIEGLADPISGDATTFEKRQSLFGQAIEAAAVNPLGAGTGATTLAASRFGGQALNSETDVGDVALSWGIPGLLTYVVVLVLGLRTAYLLAVQRQDWLSFGVLAVLFAVGLQWINGGLYSLAPVVWLCLGWADRQAVS